LPSTSAVLTTLHTIGDDDTFIEETREPLFALKTFTFCSNEVIAPAIANDGILSNGLAVLTGQCVKACHFAARHTVTANDAAEIIDLRSGVMFYVENKHLTVTRRTAEHSERIMLL
jgi:hypothetical protein